MVTVRRICFVDRHGWIDAGKDAEEDGGMACSWGVVGTLQYLVQIVGEASWGFWQTYLGPSGRP